METFKKLLTTCICEQDFLLNNINSENKLRLVTFLYYMAHSKTEVITNFFFSTVVYKTLQSLG